MGTHRDFDFLDELRDHLTILTIDLPGHGQSPWSKQTDTAEKVGDILVEILDSFEVESPVIYGYSMGGRLSLSWLDKLQPSGLFLESVGLGLNSDFARDQRQQQDDKLFENVLGANDDGTEFNAFLDRWFENPLFEGLSSHPGFPLMMELRRTQDPKLLQKAISAFSTANDPDGFEVLRSYQGPIAYLSGAWDPKYKELGDKIQTELPKATVVIAPEASHNVHAMNPELARRELQNLIDRRKD